MKRLAGWVLLALVIVLEKCLPLLILMARVCCAIAKPFHWIRMKVLMWRTNRLCRSIVRQQKRLAWLLIRRDS